MKSTGGTRATLCADGREETDLERPKLPVRVVDGITQAVPGQVDAVEASAGKLRAEWCPVCAEPRSGMEADDRRAGAKGQHPEARRVCSRTGLHEVFAGLDATVGEECTLG